MQIFVPLLIVISPFVGSFIGTIAMRLPEGRTVVFGRSHCDHCGKALSPWDLVPIASWIWLRGRCRYCHAKIGALPLATELAALIVCLMAASQTTGWIFAASCLFGWSLLTLAILDWQHYWLPDVITLPLILAGLALAYGISPDELWLHCLAAAVGMLAAGLLALLYRSTRGHEGLGLGDVKLIGALGAWLGPAGLPTAILYGVLLALASVLLASSFGQKFSRDSKIALGTFLSAGGWVVWLYGPLVAAR